MLRDNIILKYSMILITFVVAFTLEASELPSYLYLYKPLWPLLILIFWNLTYADEFNIVFAFFVGLIWDVSIGGMLGMRSLLLVVIIYILSINVKRIKNFSFIQQSIIVFGCSLGFKAGIALLYVLLRGHAIFLDFSIISAPIMTGLLWSWSYLLLRYITLTR